jgi:hypothetical protein
MKLVECHFENWGFCSDYYGHGVSLFLLKAEEINTIMVHVPPGSHPQGNLGTQR